MDSTGWRGVAIGLRETSGPTILYCGAIADGEALVRSGETIIGGTAGGTAFPVGAIYLNMTGVNPGTELGYGTWVQVAQGLTLVGAT